MEPYEIKVVEDRTVTKRYEDLTGERSEMSHLLRYL